jgi:hypothetical protein
MSTLINLLPDVRQAKLQDKRNRRLAITIMLGVILFVGAVLIIAVLTIQAQNFTINALTNSIKDKKQQVASTPDVKTMLSLQARLSALPQLYSQRVLLTKLNNILSAVEPKDLALTSVSLDASNNLNITAEGKTYLGAAKLARALEQSNLSVGQGASPSNEPHFSNVTLSAVTQSDGKTNFSITATANSGASSGK